MNRDRRKRIRAVVDSLEKAREEIVDLQAEEQEAFDNLPESLAFGERGQAMENAATELDSVGMDLEDLEARLSDLL